MPQLKHLKYETCPHCHGPVTTISFRGGVHTNGEQFEQIYFDCNCHIEWVPNFSQERESYPCGKTPIVYKIDTNPIQKTAELLQITEAEVHAAIQTGTITIKPNQYHMLHQLGWTLNKP